MPTTTTTATPGTDTDTRRTDEALVREVVLARETAMRTGDAERIIARYAPDAVRFDLAPPLRQAGADVHDVEALRGWFAGHGGSVGYEIRDLEVAVGGDVAYCHSLDRMYDPSPVGRFSLWFRSTVCLRKAGGRWLVTHEHESTPFLMDGSLTAAVDLQP
jgi:ketosteroid isomerase-like protein